MKATDLMLGDWVRIAPYDIINQVDCLLTEYAVTSHGDSWGQYDYKDIEPITLTPEILVKNGFEKKEDDDGQELYSLLLGEWAITYMSIFGCPYLTIEDVLDYDRAHSVLNLKDSIYYVHQLQQALCFCGIEKEIVS